MCTSIVEIARAEGMAKRGDEWFPLTQSVVAYDHARHAPLGDVITLDFFNTSLDAGTGGWELQDEIQNAVIGAHSGLAAAIADEGPTEILMLPRKRFQQILQRLHFCGSCLWRSISSPSSSPSMPCSKQFISAKRRVPLTSSMPIKAWLR